MEDMQTNNSSKIDILTKYISYGIIKGIGKKTANKIVEKFGISAFDVLESAPHLLTQIDGISLKKAVAISESFNQNPNLKDILFFLHEHEVPVYLTIRILEEYKAATIDIIRNNPYRFVIDIPLGGSFETADKIAHRLGIARDTPNRIVAAVMYKLLNASSYGTCYPQDQLIEQVHRMTGLSNDLIENEIVNMQLEKVIIIENPPHEKTHQWGITPVVFLVESSDPNLGYVSV